MRRTQVCGLRKLVIGLLEDFLNIELASARVSKACLETARPQKSLMPNFYARRYHLKTSLITLPMMRETSLSAVQYTYEVHRALSIIQQESLRSADIISTTSSTSRRKTTQRSDVGERVSRCALALRSYGRPNMAWLEEFSLSKPSLLNVQRIMWPSSPHVAMWMCKIFGAFSLHGSGCVMKISNPRREKSW